MLRINEQETRLTVHVNDDDDDDDEVNNRCLFISHFLSSTLFLPNHALFFQVSPPKQYMHLSPPHPSYMPLPSHSS